MLLVTVLSWLKDAGEVTSSELRVFVGLKVKGTPISTKLNDASKRGLAEIVDKGSSAEARHVFRITPAGIKFVEDNIKDVESIDIINSREYSKGVVVSDKVNKTKKVINVSKGARNAMESLGDLIQDNKHSKDMLKGMAIRLNNMAMQIEEYLQEECDVE